MSSFDKFHEITSTGKPDGETQPSMCDMMYMLCAAAAMEKQMDKLSNNPNVKPDPRYLSVCEYAHVGCKKVLD